MSWSDSHVFDDCVRAFEACGCHVTIPERTFEILEENGFDDRQVLDLTSVERCDSIGFRKTQLRHFRAGKSTAAAIALAKQLDNPSFCVSDSSQDHVEFDTANVNYWDTIGMSAHLVDRGALKFDRAQFLLKGMRDTNSEIPPNYSALLKNKAASTPV